MDFLDTYAQKLESLDALKYELDKEIKALKEQIDVAYNNLRQLNIQNFNEIMYNYKKKHFLIASFKIPFIFVSN